MLGELINRAARLQDSLAIRERYWRAGRTRAATLLKVIDEHIDQAKALEKRLDQTRDQENNVEDILTKIFAYADALKNEASQNSN